MPIELVLSKWPELQAVTIRLPVGREHEYSKQLPVWFKKGQTPLLLAYEENGRTLKIITRYKVGLNQEVLSILAENKAFFSLTL